MITPNEFKLMQDVTRCLAQVVFDNEETFKDNLLKDLRWEKEDYELERIHFCGYRCRITIKFTEDYSTYDIYLEADKIYEFYEQLKENQNV